MAEASKDHKVEGRVGPGGTIVVDTKIEAPPPPPRPANAAMTHKDLQSVESIGDTPVVMNKPYGSEPRNLDPKTGRLVPFSEEQTKELDERVDARAQAAAERTAREEEEGAARSEAQRKAGEARQKEIDAAAKAGRDRGSKADADDPRRADFDAAEQAKKNTEEQHKARSEAQAKLAKQAKTPGTTATKR